MTGNPGAITRPRALLDRLVWALAEDAAAWRLQLRTAVAVAAIPPVLATIVAAAHLHRPLYRFLTGEDSLLEWLQVGLIGVAVVALALCARALAGRRERTWAVLFALGAGVALVIAGEEISWGQRLLGLETPEALENVNTQGETNLHNVRGVLPAINFGVLIGAGSLTLLPPVALAARNAGRALPRDSWRLVPPLALVPAFALPFAYRTMRFVTAGGTSGSFAEMSELSLYFGVASFSTLILLRVRRSPVVIGGRGDP